MSFKGQLKPKEILSHRQQKRLVEAVVQRSIQLDLVQINIMLALFEQVH